MRAEAEGMHGEKLRIKNYELRSQNGNRKM
jgi:hypothetical protein